MHSTTIKKTETGIHNVLSVCRLYSNFQSKLTEVGQLGFLHSTNSHKHLKICFLIWKNYAIKVYCILHGCYTQTDNITNYFPKHITYYYHFSCDNFIFNIISNTNKYNDLRKIIPELQNVSL